MKNKKKRVLFITVVMVVILCMSSTALAATTRNYSKGFTSTYSSTGVTTYMKSSLKDQNTRCYFASGANEYKTGYISRLMAQQVLSAFGDLGGWYQHDAKHNDSGKPVTMSYSNIYGIASNGMLGFKNSDAPGYYLSVTGQYTIS